MLPVPLIVLLLRSKLPPSCGVVSSITLLNDPEPDPEVTTVVIPVILPFPSTVMTGVSADAP